MIKIEVVVLKKILNNFFHRNNLFVLFIITIVISILFLNISHIGSSYAYVADYDNSPCTRMKNGTFQGEEETWLKKI